MSNLSPAYSTRASKGKFEKRYLTAEHLARCRYLVYSPTAAGCFCLPCALFGPCSNTGGVGGQPLKKLVTEPLTTYSHLFGDCGYLSTHERNKYHINAISRADDFLKNYESNTDIAKKIDVGRKQQADSNRAKLEPIVKTVVFCARSNLPFRGHRDDGPLTEGESTQNDGLFRQLLRFRMEAGDSTLADHVKTAAKNATYCSKTVQNEIILTAGDILREKLLNRIISRPFPVFTLMADETTDISGIEQMSVVVRYVDLVGDKYIIREDFLDFLPVTDLTGMGLADKLKTYVNDNFGTGAATNMVGQGYDGAAAMSGRLNGVQAHLRKDFPLAVFVHCASHRLNLVLSASCSLAPVRNAQSTVAEVANFVNKSSLI